MTRSRLILALLALGGVGLLVPSLAWANTEILETKLKGAEEVGRGDQNGRGFVGLFVKNPTRRKLCFDMAWDRIEPATAVHVHKGAAGTDGPLKITLFEDVPGHGNDYGANGCIRVSRQIARNLRKAPEKFYVNVVNSRYPDGAIRGQLERDRPGVGG